MLQYFPIQKSQQFAYVFDDLEISIDDTSEALFLHECHWQGESILAYDIFHLKESYKKGETKKL
jgi:hypothetical protein